MGFTASAPAADAPPTKAEQLKCPRCDSTNTKFCYFNNYSRAQPRHFCKSCKRHWTAGGALRNVPVGGCRKASRRPRAANPRPAPAQPPHAPPPGPQAPADDWALSFPLFLMGADDWGPAWDLLPPPPPPPPPPLLPFEVSSSSSASSGCWGACWDDIGGLYSSDYANSPPQ
ncbi:uncharacterized protein LOC144712440 [Wolffia australiana]